MIAGAAGAAVSITSDEVATEVFPIASRADATTVYSPSVRFANTPESGVAVARFSDQPLSTTGTLL